MNEKDNCFYTIINGKKEKYKIIKIITPPNGKYKYVVYENDNKEIYASRFKLKKEDVILENIKYQYEFDYIDRVMEGEE